MSGTKLPLLRTSNAQPGQNSPHTKPGRPNQYKTLPADGPNGPTRYKTLPTHHKTAIPSHFSLAGRTLYRSSHQQAKQGELCTAHRTTSGTKPSPHETRQAEPVQNSPSRRPQWAHPVQNSPHTPQNGDTKPFLACRENFVPLKPPTSQAGRTLYRTQDHLRDKTLPTRNPGSSVPHSGVTVWWSARLIWVRSPCDPSRKLSTSDSK